MRQLFFKVGALVVVLFIVAVAAFKPLRDQVFGLATKGSYAARGYMPAKTPQELVDRFRKAMEGRDYDVAVALYLADGPYKDQMNKATDAATELTKWIDKLSGQMKNKGYSSAKINGALAIMQPMPAKSNFTLDAKQASDDKTYAVFVEEKDERFADQEPWSSSTQVPDFLIMARALVKDFKQGARVELVKVGKGDEASWKFNLPAGANTQTAVDKLVKRYKDAARFLEHLYDVTSYDRLPKTELEDKFKSELEKELR